MVELVNHFILSEQREKANAARKYVENTFDGEVIVDDFVKHIKYEGSADKKLDLTTG